MRVSSPKCWRFTSSTRSSFARPGPVHPKVRSVRRSDGSTEWNGDAIGHRRDAESCREYFFKVMLANVDILAAAAQILAASRRLHDALNSCLQQHLRYSMQRHYRANQSPRKLDYPNASCRRLHGPRVTPSMHVLAGMFHARASFTPKRVLRSLHIPKKCSQRYVKQRAQLRARHGPLAYQNAQYIDRNTSPKRPAHAAHDRRKALHT